AIVLLFVLAGVEHGPVKGAWVAGGVCYVLALMYFCAVAIPALVFRTRLTWKEWSLLAFASAFAMLAYLLGFPELVGIGIYGLASGLGLGLFLLFINWRLRVK